jgi:Cell Wall Hydrolase
MLHAPATDRKNQAQLTKSTTLAEHERQNQTVNWSGQFSATRDRHNIATIQQAYGNQAALRMLRTHQQKSSSINSRQGVLQRKCACGNSAESSGSCAECQSKQEGILQTQLQIGEPGNRYEQEADRVADQVMTMPASAVQETVGQAPAPEKEEIQNEAISKYPQVIQRHPKTGKCSNAAIQNCTDEDLLTAICIGETGNVKDRDGKKGVMNVVMNRVSDGSFGANIRAVATASGQFHGLANGINLLNNSSFADCRPLAQDVMADPSNDPTSAAVFFDQSCAKPCEQYCTVYLGDGTTGAHYFARRATPSEKKECQNKKTNPSGVNRYCCDNPKKRVYILPVIEIVGSASAEKNGEEETQDTTP